MGVISIETIVFISVYAYNLFLINSYGKLVGFKLDKKKSLIFFPIIMSIISFAMIVNLVFLPIVYIVNFLVYMLVFKIIFDKTLGSIYIMSICQIFQLIINRDIIIGLIAFISGNSMYNTVQDYKIYIFTCACTRIIVIIVGIIFNKEKYINKFRMLLIYRRNILMNILTITSLVIILLNSNYTYYYSGDIYTTTTMMIANRICIYFCFGFAIGMSFKSIKWVEEEVFYKTNLLSLEYNDNINKKIDEYSNLLRMYNHDFKNILYSIRDSIEMGKIEKAKDIILEFDGKIHGLTNYNKKFSNNVLINALLNRLDEKCSSKNIFCDLDCYIPESFGVTELELVNIFTNLSNNAFEACIKQENNEEKYIIFKSYVKDNNLIIYQSNSFDGHIKFINDRLITTKKNKNRHGIGVESIKHIINEVGGMELIKVDKEKREFKFLIKIPL